MGFKKTKNPAVKQVFIFKNNFMSDQSEYPKRQ